MCGLFGILTRGGSRLDKAVLIRGTAAIHMRGPDDEGYVLICSRTGEAQACLGDDSQDGLDHPHIGSVNADAYDIGFGFRRLSIQDLSIAGHQPMAAPDRRHWVAFNGEIYNFVELRGELEALGYSFRGGSDTEVVLAAYDAWGTDCLRRFAGMWAIAIWDTPKRVLVLARDPFGIKPLYYHLDARGLIFGSELKSLLTAPWIERRVDPQAVFSFLQRGRPGLDNRSMIRRVRQLPSGCFGTLKLGEAAVNGKTAPEDALAIERYWSVDPSETVPRSFADAATALRELFLESIRIHLRADVPVGVNLSGGIDSSAVLMCARRLLGKDHPIHTFSFIAKEKAINEEHWIDHVARQAQATVHKIEPHARQLTSDLEELMRIQDEPIGSTSPYAQFRVFKLVRDHKIKVTLDGQGADELLAGYRSYLPARAASELRNGNRVRALALAFRAARYYPTSAGGLMRDARVMAAAYPPANPQPASPYNPYEMPDWLNREWFADHKVVDLASWQAGKKTVLKENLYFTLTESSLPELLRFADRNSMGHSIESRVPFLTPGLARFIMSLPEEHLIGADGTTKNVFRAAMRGLVPDGILDRKDKIGFTTPERNWLLALDDWVLSAYSDERASCVAALHPFVLREEWRNLKAGRTKFNQQFWRWVNLVNWSEQNRVSYQ